MTAVTVMTAVSHSEVSSPPSAVPPESTARTVMAAVPKALARAVNFRSPSPSTLGWSTNRLGLDDRVSNSRD